MPFTTIFSLPGLAVSYDSHRHCLSLRLQGQLDALALQDITLKIANTTLQYPAGCQCLVQDNLVLAEEGAKLEARLLDQLLVFQRAGIAHWLWVRSPTSRSYHLAEQVANRLPQAMLTVFDDVEHATTWLQRCKQLW